MGDLLWGIKWALVLLVAPFVLIGLLDLLAWIRRPHD